MRVSSLGFLPNSRSHVHGVGKMDREARCVVVQRFKRKRNFFGTTHFMPFFRECTSIGVTAHLLGVHTPTMVPGFYFDYLK